MVTAGAASFLALLDSLHLSVMAFLSNWDSVKMGATARAMLRLYGCHLDYAGATHGAGRDGLSTDALQGLIRRQQRLGKLYLRHP